MQLELTTEMEPSLFSMKLVVLIFFIKQIYCTISKDNNRQKSKLKSYPKHTHIRIEFLFTPLYLHPRPLFASHVKCKFSEPLFLTSSRYHPQNFRPSPSFPYRAASSSRRRPPHTLRRNSQPFYLYSIFCIYPSTNLPVKIGGLRGGRCFHRLHHDHPIVTPAPLPRTATIRHLFPYLPVLLTITTSESRSVIQPLPSAFAPLIEHTPRIVEAPPFTLRRTLSSCIPSSVRADN